MGVVVPKDKKGPRGGTSITPDEVIEVRVSEPGAWVPEGGGHPEPPRTQPLRANRRLFAERMALAFQTVARIASEQGDDEQADLILQGYEVWQQNGGPGKTPHAQIACAVDALLLAEAGGEAVGAFALLTEQVQPSLYDPPPPNLAEAAKSWSPWAYARFLALGMVLPQNPDAGSNRQIATLVVTASELLSDPVVHDTRIPSSPKRLRRVLRRTMELLTDDKNALPYTFSVVSGILARNPANDESAIPVKADKDDSQTRDWIKTGVAGLVAAFGLASKLDKELGLRDLLSGLTEDDE